MNKTKRRVAVVGAGLAGLSCAYELSKDPNVHVEVFEKQDSVGGRVRTLPVNGVPVDFGGFIVYPWYEQFHRLLEELTLQNLIRPIALKDILYDIDGDHHYRTEKDIDFPVSDTVRLYPRMALKVLSQDDMAEPDVYQFKGQTVSEHFRQLLGVQHETLYERFTDIVCQGYCYGPVDTYKMAFLAPIVRFQRLYGDITKAFYFPEGIGALTHALADAVQTSGGRLHLSSPVTKVNHTTLTTADGDHVFDAIVFALPANDPLYATLVPEVVHGCDYTHFYTITVQADATPMVNDRADWGAVFYRPERHLPYQVLSSINLPMLYDDSLNGYVNFNVVVRDALTQDGTLTMFEVLDRIAPSLKLLFPGTTWKEAVQMNHWTHTMPIAQEGFVERVQAQQGENGWYFAGDYLGSPSMETAILTGVRSAHQVLGIEEPSGIERIQQASEAFKQKVHKTAGRIKTQAEGRKRKKKHV